MVEYALKVPPAAYNAIAPDDARTAFKVLSSLTKETAHPAAQQYYAELTEGLATYGNCVIATALFIAARNKEALEKGTGEEWHAVLVEDPDFPIDHPLRTHWVASNKDETINLDMTIASASKDVKALGGKKEELEVKSYVFRQDNFERRLQIALDRFVDKDNKPILPGVTGKTLFQQIYGSVLEKNGLDLVQAKRPERTIRTTPVAQCARLIMK